MDLLSKSTNFKASTNLKEGLEHSDIIFIIVQTPNSGNDKFYDHSILSNLLVISFFMSSVDLTSILWTFSGVFKLTGPETN